MSERGHWFSPARIAAVAVLASIPIRSVTEKLIDPDLWWHLRTGELIATTKRIPTQDVFSYTAAGRDWTVQEWGAELILHGLREAFGLWGIVAFKAVLLFAIYALAARIIIRHTGSGIGSWILVGLTAYAGATNWTERPNLLSFLLFVITLDLLDRRDQRAIWWFVPIALVWANLHGMVILGLGLVALVALTEWLAVALRWGAPDAAWGRRVGQVFVLGLLASFINPRGPGLFTHAFGLVRTVSSLVTEWASPDFHEVGTYAFLLLLSLTITVFAFRPGPPAAIDLAMAGAFIMLALQAARNLAVASIVLGLVVARNIGPAWEAFRGDRPARASTAVSIPLGTVGWVALLAGFGIVLATGVPKSSAPEDIIDEAYPVAAIDALARPGVRVLAFDAWATMVIDRAWPDATVFFDLRSDMYGVDLVRRYGSTLGGGPGWEENLDSTCTTHVLIEPVFALAQLLEVSPEWDVERQDEISITYVRGEPAPGCESFPIPA